MNRSEHVFNTNNYEFPLNSKLFSVYPLFFQAKHRSVCWSNIGTYQNTNLREGESHCDISYSFTSLIYYVEFGALIIFFLVINNFFCHIFPPHYSNTKYYNVLFHAFLSILHICGSHFECGHYFFVWFSFSILSKYSSYLNNFLLLSCIFRLCLFPPRDAQGKWDGKG